MRVHFREYTEHRRESLCSPERREGFRFHDGKKQLAYTLFEFERHFDDDDEGDDDSQGGRAC